MIYSSLYRLMDFAIEYQTLSGDGIIVPFQDFGLIRETAQGRLVSKAMDDFCMHQEARLHAKYHLAAIHEKYKPNEWDWDDLMTFQEKRHNDFVWGENGYFALKGITRWPEFHSDYDAWEYDRKLYEWAIENGIYKTDEEFRALTLQKIQTEIYEKSKTDFIHLTDEQVAQMFG